MHRSFSICRASLLAAALLLADPGQGHANDIEYLGMCEASAAVAAGPDHFIVANDEETLALYKRGTQKPIWIKGAEEIFGVEVSDIEGAAAIGQRIYWITSHSLNSEGEDKRKRRLLLATRITGDGDNIKLGAVGAPYRDLRERMLKADELKPFDLETAATLPPKQEKSLDIEGLAATPDGRLLIGFRSPIPDGRALIVPLLNPDEVVMAGAKAKFGKPMRPDLGGLGIRSLEGFGNGYLLMAGPFGTGDGFSLFQWSGDESEKPRMVSLPTLAKSFTPEAMFAVPGSKMVQILSDDGRFRAELHGKKCDKNSFPDAERKFRGIAITP